MFQGKEKYYYILILLIFLHGLVQLSYNMEVFILNFCDIKMKICSWPAKSRAKTLHGYGSWPGSILVAQVDHFQFQQENGEKITEKI